MYGKYFMYKREVLVMNRNSFLLSFSKNKASAIARNGVNREYLMESQIFLSLVDFTSEVSFVIWPASKDWFAVSADGECFLMVCSSCLQWWRAICLEVEWHDDLMVPYFMIQKPCRIFDSVPYDLIETYTKPSLEIKHGPHVSKIS